MKENIKDYLFHKKRFLGVEFCEYALETLTKSKWEEHDFTGYENNDPEHGFSWQREVKTKHEMEPEFIGFTSPDWNKDHAHINNVIINHLSRTLTEYIKSFSYPWFNGWNGYSVIKFLKYAEEHKMAEHCDHISSLFDGNVKGIPMLSIVGQFNNDFEGGEFVMWGDQVINLEAGDLIIFPSNFMYPHRVEPVTKGDRYSYVSWAY
jgi:hypothetical protein